MREIEKLKEAILKEYPRLSADNSFCFNCHAGVPCFNDCCGDVNIFLTPYDILRLKNNLGINSQEFLDKYTISPFDKNLKHPVVLLKMNDDDKKTCPFVADKGCTVYNDRPWACRMYPLGLASPGDDHPELDNEFYFLLKESVCKGFNEDRKQTIKEWLTDQGIEEYDKAGEDYKQLTLHKGFDEADQALDPRKVEMFHTACYNIDSFRKFIFGSTFFNRFEVDDETKKKIEKDDYELLKFGYKWLRFSLFGEKTIIVKKDALEAREKELKEKTK